jgi:hypothetical protein
MEDGQKTQLQEANEALVALLPNITTSDRKEATSLFAEFTIVQYLKGRGKDLDTTVALLQFFRKRIEERAKVISDQS